ncbi:hypothetical protein [Legionella sp.]|uniref:hypothetical protein n=1 Tax=Legionella sp. TaxID=459 RepID=UPI003CC64CFE
MSPWYTMSADKKVTLEIEMFLSSTCPHCHKAEAFFRDLAIQHPELHIKRNIINEDKNALLRFNELLSEQHMDDFSVPSIYFCESRWIGFASAETTGKDLLHAINYCKQQIEINGTLTLATVDTLRHWANANKFDSGMVKHPSVLTYIVTIAITDAFAPCAFFCFAGFLAFLFVGEKKEKKIIAGLLFITSVVMTHYLQQTHTSFFYQMLPWLRIPVALVGILAVYFVVQHYKKQTNQALYFSLAFLFGLMIMAYQQTCVMNWAYIFEQWLNNLPVTKVEAAFYRLLYQFLYVMPLLLILILYLMMLSLKRFAAWQPRLINWGLLFILAIALCFIAYPMLLSYLVVSVFTIIILVICARFLNLT